MRTPTQSLNWVRFERNGQSFLQCAALPFFVIMTLIGISGSHLPSSRVCVSSSTISTVLPVFLYSNTTPIKMQQVTISASFHPVTVRPSALYPPIHGSCMAPRRRSLYQCQSCQGSWGSWDVLSVNRQFWSSTWWAINALDVQQLALHCQTFPIQMSRHQVCGIHCTSDLLDLVLLVQLSAAAKSTSFP